ncbi:MAG: thioredoxin domain-containing protein, partial [Candidatus Eisenbacteria bacterium]|nr:thioredoxin domain-containing protein [Candidatus Eisenbacteria bacterium]
MNRLEHEKSPYLLQHASNPVDWYPWGDEAFMRARAEDRPVLLSIGYSTCHWCHVMERESFQDSEVAALLNRSFVCVKVDREERPDVDAVYMEAGRTMSGGGGWPLTLFMAPDRRPFFAMTYIPKTGRFGRPGMMELVPRIAELWSTQRGELLDTAGRVVSALLQETAQPVPRELGVDVMDRAYARLRSEFDGEHGGFGTRPKFPTPHQLLFLLRYWNRAGERDALAMVEATMAGMRQGGIHDHVGFGFHRYSTDEAWLVPHFEKMLYDQAMMVMACTESYLATGKHCCEHTLRGVVEYVLRDLTDDLGAFYSAEDADSEGVEGKFYTWKLSELRELLGEDDLEFATSASRLTEEGNVRDEATGRPTGVNILHLADSPGDLAKKLGVTEQAFFDRLESVRSRLFEARSRRVRPSLDDKILTDWNGLMIAALARASQALGEPSFADAARRAADFVLTTMRNEEGRLLHRYRDGEAAILANADDHAFLAMGLFDLYEATHETRYLRESARLMDDMLTLFWDGDGGGFFFSPRDGESLLTRRKEIYDGAVPSSNSVALLNLLRLGSALARPDLTELADSLVRAFAGTVAASPSAHTMFLTAYDFALGPSVEVVIAGDPEDDHTGALLDVTRGLFR